MPLGFEISVEQQELKGEVAKLAKEFGSKVDEWDRRSEAPGELFREMGVRR